MKRKTTPICLMAALMLVSAAGCGSSSKKNSSSETVGTTAPAVTSAEKSAQPEETTADTEQTEASSEAAQSVEEFVPGDGLKKLCEQFAGDYTYSVKSSYSDDPDEVIEVKESRQGDKVYITYTDNGHKTADRAYWFNGEKAYETENDIGIYSERDEWTGYNLMLSLADKKPTKTESNLPDAPEGGTIEQYTYAGDTYITVFDLYFDKDGGFTKYTVRYSVEGEDDLIETCEVTGLETSAEIKGDPLEKLKDFDAMTEDERLGFCQEVCGERGISTDDMYEMNITTDDLKRIGFEEFTELVWKYGESADKKD